MSAENESQSEAQKPVASDHKAVTKSLNLSERAEEAKKAEQDPDKSKKKERKLVLPPQPLPNNRPVPRDEILNDKDQT